MHTIIRVLAWMPVVMATSALAANDHRHDGHGAPPRTDWTAAPILLPAGGRDRTGATYFPANIVTDDLLIFDPDGSTPRQADRIDNTWRVALSNPLRGGFHWLQARAADDRSIRTATTVWYSPNKGPSPAEMIATVRNGLEIVPLPVPDHNAYREGSTWRFLVRHDGRPLPQTPVVLDTEFGSSLRTTTDKDGIAHVLFPRDFDPDLIEKSGAGRARAKFALSAAHDNAGIRHLTAFNYQYAPDLLRQRNLDAGIGFALLGMLMAAPMLFRRGSRQSTESPT